MLNLVEEKQALIESPTNAFSPFEVYYAETFIIPSDVEEYTISLVNNKETIKFIMVYVR